MTMRAAMRVILATGLCAIALGGLEAAARQGSKQGRHAIDHTIPAGPSGCDTVINGKNHHLAAGERLFADGRWRSCTQYDGHPVIDFAE